MTKREARVITAFENCVTSGEFTEDYAITLIEDNQRYGWLSEEAKETFYDFLTRLHIPEVHVNQVTIRSVTPIPAEEETPEEETPTEETPEEETPEEEADES